MCGMEGQNCTIFFNPPARMFAAVLKINTIFMQIKGFIFVFCLWATVCLQATNTTYNLPKPNQTEFICNVPAPSNFQVLEVGTTMAKLSWDYQSDAIGGYRIRTYRTSDNFLISTNFKSQDQLNVVVDGLTMGVAYYAIINSRCGDYSDSGQESSAPFNTLILDLIVDGFQGGAGVSICSIPAQGMSCVFSSSGDYFKVTGPNGKPKCFRMKRSTNPGLFEYECKVLSNVPSLPFYFTCEGNVAPNPECYTDFISIWDNIQGVPTVVATFTVNTGTAPDLRCTYIRTGYTIEKQTEIIGGGRYRDASSESVAHATTSPNPFTETLEVFIANETVENVQLQLFNLNGQQVLQQQFAGAAGQYQLSTSHLSPGFYFLRIEADGEVQTLKVIKSE